MEKIKCSKCGKKFENTGTSSLCPECRLKRTPKIYFTIATLILILGFIGGIVIGGTNKILNDEYEKIFNTSLMIYCWIGDALFSMFVYAIGSIIHRLNLLIDKENTNKE